MLYVKLIFDSENKVNLKVLGWREENTIVKEREIDLRDLLAELLSHWRVLLIYMLAGAVLAGGYGLMRALKEQAVQTEASVNAEEAAETQEIGETADAPGRGISDGIDRKSVV